MKFSISFKYSNVTFKNKETKETISYDTKAEGNTFTFDNVDEDVVLGIVKGIKDRKASQVFAYDDFRTNFINVMARNKCKELYDKLDKGSWKVEDIAISNITIKDLEFTKPTMNAREVITVESRKMRESSEFKPGDIVDWFVPDDDEQYGKEFGGEVFHGGEVYKKQGDVYEVSFGEEGLFYPQGKDLEYHSENLLESRKMNESKYGKGPWPTWVVKERLVQLINGVSKEHPMWADLVDILEKYYGSMDVEKLVGESKKMRESSESTGGTTIEPVIFKRDKRDGEVVAFFPETMFDGSVNRGNIMCYAHNGQSSEASIEYFQECRPCKDEAEYADLLAEL